MYALILFAIYGLGVATDGNLITYTVIFLALQMPLIIVVIIQGLWLRSDTLRMRKCLVISFVVLVATIVISLFWQIGGAAIMFGGTPSLFAYVMLNFPESFNVDAEGRGPDGQTQSLEDWASDVLLDEILMVLIFHLVAIIFFSYYVNVAKRLYDFKKEEEASPFDDLP